MLIYLLLHVFFSLLFLSLRFVNGVKFSAETIMDMPFMLSEGKRQYDALSARTIHFGACWDQAMIDLQAGCKSLTEDLQSSLAFRFTDCFLQKSGHKPLVCESFKPTCLQELSDRAFNAYTEFYTHTQSICYYLQSKLWHAEAELTINRLSSSSRKVSYQLAEAEKTQETLINQQKESIVIQELLAENLKSSKETISQVLFELQTSTLEQQANLLSLFDRLSSLQSWLINEVSWIESLFFYATASFLTILFTSLPRTQRARLPVFVILTINYAVERFLVGQINGPKDSLILFSEDLASWIWFVRKGAVAISVAMICIQAVLYSDYDVLNNRLLHAIHNQNNMIIAKLISTDYVDSSLFKGGNTFVTTESEVRSPSSTFNGIEPIKEKSAIDVPGRFSRESSVIPFIHLSPRRESTSSSVDVNTDFVQPERIKSLRRSSRIRR